MNCTKHCRQHDTSEAAFTFVSIVHRSSALLNHRTSRGGVQFFLDQSESPTQFQYVSERRGKAAAHEEEVPQAGPGRSVLLEHQRELERGHHGGVVHDTLQLLAALVQLQVDVQDAASEAAGLAGRQQQHLPRYSAQELLWYQHRGAVQRRLLGSEQALLKHGSQLLTRSVCGDVGVPLGLSQAVVPEVQLWHKTSRMKKPAQNRV